MTIAEIQALMKKLFGQSDAITAQAKKEKRDLNDEELAAQEKILAEIEQAETDLKAAQAKDAKAKDTADRLAAKRKELTAARPPRTVEAGPVEAEAERPVVESVRANLLDSPTFNFKSLGEFAMAARGKGRGAHSDERILELKGAVTGNNETIDSDGGILTPPEFAKQIWDGANRGSMSLVPYCDVYNIMGKSISFPANAETSRANGSRYGGINAYWLSEGAQGTNAHPKVRQLVLEPKKIMALVPVTEELLEDAGPVITDYLNRAATEEIGFKLNDAIVNGTGAGQPKGFLQSSSTVSVAKEAGQAATTIVYKNVLNMYSRMHVRGMANFVWFINQDTLPQLAQMTMPVGTGGLPVFLPPGGASASPYSTLFGRPVIPTEWNATLGTTGDIVAADLGFYALAFRGALRSAVSIHLRFDYDEQVFKFALRADGQPWLASAITPFKGSATVSPIIKLDTRA